jgi:anti-sigma factor RsiW
MEAWRAADLHAYVDDCLESDERLAFETQMAQEPALARRAAQWRAQNSAIRAAFDAESARTFSISIVRHQSENLGRARRPTPPAGKPSYEQPAQPSAPTIVDASRLPAKTVATVVPTKGLAEAGVAAFQAFARLGVEPVEFATGDATQAQAWLTARLAHPVFLPAEPAGVKLIGARITPYPGAPAAFLMYKSQEGALGLLIRLLDAPAAKAPELLAADGRDAAVWAQRGQGLALVGDPAAGSLLKIATEFVGPIEAAQAMPERGW